ncbi:hypothetical protein [Vibrio cyclitrophicus]|uniref:hypothetical protein n=1 Tax=Vibrio cyclitrophicus TaxID=47951 RepID=UPI000C851BBA|nr:hypothetical protein [Vibrio cyclitrophicus]PMH47834.1 hypothetical protein BCU67_20315 [Vibrio cyclitrophicus]
MMKPITVATKFVDILEDEGDAAGNRSEYVIKNDMGITITDIRIVTDYHNKTWKDSQERGLYDVSSDKALFNELCSKGDSDVDLINSFVDGSHTSVKLRVSRNYRGKMSITEYVV